MTDTETMHVYMRNDDAPACPPDRYEIHFEMSGATVHMTAKQLLNYATVQVLAEEERAKQIHSARTIEGIKRKKELRARSDEGGHGLTS